MKMKFFTIIALLLFAASPALSDTYNIWDTWGGTWADADKTWTDDTLLCWAGAASNILEYTGWGLVDGMTTTDDMFAHYTANFDDAGSLPNYAWDWWWDGTNPRQGDAGWAQDNAAGGGGFYPSLNVNDYMISSSTDSAALTNIDNWLHDGYGVTLAIRGNIDHAITAWGFEYDATDTDYYTGIYVTDSDDNTNALQYYDLSLTGGQWFMDSYGTNRYIGEVYALQIVPVPGAVLLGILGLSVAGLKLRKHA